MLLLKEIPVWCEWNNGKVLLFPNVEVRIKWQYCVNFFRDQDRYGRSRLWILFPADSRLEGNTIIQDNNHKTFLIWGTKLEVTSGVVTPQVLSVPHTDCPIQNRYHHLISAPKGTTLKIRDEDGEEMELTF